MQCNLEYAVWSFTCIVAVIHYINNTMTCNPNGGIVRADDKTAPTELERGPAHLSAADGCSGGADP